METYSETILQNDTQKGTRAIASGNSGGNIVDFRVNPGQHDDKLFSFGGIRFSVEIL